MDPLPLSIAAFVYDVYLFFDLFGFFGGAPFHYGFIARAFALSFSSRP